MSRTQNGSASWNLLHALDSVAPFHALSAPICTASLEKIMRFIEKLNWNSFSCRKTADVFREWGSTYNVYRITYMQNDISETQMPSYSAICVWQGLTPIPRINHHNVLCKFNEHIFLLFRSIFSFFWSNRHRQPECLGHWTNRQMQWAWMACWIQLAAAAFPVHRRQPII